MAELRADDDKEVEEMELLQDVKDYSRRKQSLIEEMENTEPIDVGDGALMCDIDNNCGEGRRYMFFGQGNNGQEINEPRKVEHTDSR